MKNNNNNRKKIFNIIAGERKGEGLQEEFYSMKSKKTDVPVQWLLNGQPIKDSQI